MVLPKARVPETAVTVGIKLLVVFWGMAASPFVIWTDPKDRITVKTRENPIELSIKCDLSAFWFLLRAPVRQLGGSPGKNQQTCLVENTSKFMVSCIENYF